MSSSVSTEWQTGALGAVGGFKKGKGIAKKETIHAGIPCVRYAEIYTDYDYVIKNFRSFISVETAKTSVRLIPGDIIFAGSGETVEDIGKSVAYIDEGEAYVGGDSIVFTPTTPLNSVFLSYQLNDDVRRVQLRKMGQGASIVHIYSSSLEQLKVTLPPLPEQQKIVAILTSVDNVIETTQAQIDKLKDLKTGMMQELLTKGIGHSEFKDSPVGRIPVGWEVKKIGEVAKKVKPGPFGSSLTKSMYVKSGYKVYGQEQVISGDVTKGDYFIDEKKYQELSGFIVKPMDVLISLVGTFGKILIFPRGAEEGIINPRLLLLRFGDDIDPYFFGYLLKSTYVVDQLTRFQQGGTMGVLSATTLKPIIVVIPSLTEQHEIASILSAMDENIEEKQRKLGQFILIKKALMQDLLTGKVRVKVD